MLFLGRGADLEISSHLSRIAVAKVGKHFSVLPAGELAVPPSPPPASKDTKIPNAREQRTLLALQIIMARRVAFYAGDIETTTKRRQGY